MKFIDFLLKKYQIKKKTQKTLLRFFFAFKMQLKKKGASLMKINFSRFLGEKFTKDRVFYFVLNFVKILNFNEIKFKILIKFN